MCLFGGTRLEPHHSVSVLLTKGGPERIGLLRFLISVSNEPPFAEGNEIQTWLVWSIIPSYLSSHGCEGLHGVSRAEPIQC